VQRQAVKDRGSIVTPEKFFAFQKNKIFSLTKINEAETSFSLVDSASSLARAQGGAKEFSVLVGSDTLLLNKESIIHSHNDVSVSSHNDVSVKNSDPHYFSTESPLLAMDFYQQCTGAFTSCL